MSSDQCVQGAACPVFPGLERRDMSSSPEEELRTVLDGGAVPLTDKYDVAPESPQPMKLRHNVCYIVMGILVNEQNEVLMMQEAKAECWGSWYLPAGRLKRGESLVEGLCREVTEETGLLCQPLTLLVVEERGGSWVRFVFLAQETGGVLKPSAAADKESLQASWWDTESALPLRSRDILPLIKLALEYRRLPSHPSILPQLCPSPFLVLRLLLVWTSPGGIQILQSSTGHLPTIVCAARCGSILVPLLYLLQDRPETYGILGVQHQGGDNADGVCFNIMGVFRGPEPPVVRTGGLSWATVEDEGLKERLEQALQKNTLLPLHS
ncbi:8-oxo-dGDP phosphatase NUDT18 isoform X1 [Bufo gargarizans]|uniref:8-oxo-dGDP phosphatase NUDT18 isoform X1 n=2 Tax=Bufo gargarizans TaxID=30331 RepID=UPI001CF2430A|nr:8-oxo-dGDP phosphatase NUDT18 isoform X1 [Bufo gargarizans]